MSDKNIKYLFSFITTKIDIEGAFWTETKYLHVLLYENKMHSNLLQTKMVKVQQKSK